MNTIYELYSSDGSSRQIGNAGQFVFGKSLKVAGWPKSLALFLEWGSEQIFGARTQRAAQQRGASVVCARRAFKENNTWTH